MNTQGKAKFRSSSVTHAHTIPIRGMLVPAVLSAEDSELAMQVAQQVADDTPQLWTRWQIRVIEAIQRALRKRLAESSVQSELGFVCPDYRLHPSLAGPSQNRKASSAPARPEGWLGSADLNFDFPPDTQAEEFAEIADGIADEVPLMSVPWELLVYRLALEKLMARQTPYLN